MKLKLSILLIGLLLGLTTTFTAKAPNAVSHRCVQDLPVEVRELVFKRFNIKEYADFLTTASGMTSAGASLQFELDLIKKSAHELNNLGFVSRRHRECIASIISGVETLVRLRYSLPDEIQSRELAGDQEMSTFRENFLILTSLSDSKLWHGVILRALKGRNKWDQVFHRLSEDFISKHLNALLGALAMDGEIDLLNHIVESQTVPLDDELTGIIFSGVIFNGSIDIFNKVYQKLSFNATILPSSIQYALIFKRHDLFRHLLKMSLSQTAFELKELVFSGYCNCACYYGELDIVKEFLETYGFLIKGNVKMNCLLNACAGGNMPVIKFLIWNEEDQCERLEMNLQFDDFHTMICMAAVKNEAKVLQFFLNELRYRPGVELIYQELVVQALKAGSLEAFEALLGLNRCESLLMPSLGFDINNHELLVKIANEGRVDVIECLLILRESMADVDDRWNGFDLDAAANIMLKAACRTGKVQFLQYLLQKDENNAFILPSIDPGHDENACLIKACCKGHLAIVQELLRTDDNGHQIYPTVHLGARNNKALCTAIARGHLKIVTYLLRRERGDDGILHYSVPGASLCIRDAALLYSAMLYEKLEILNFLLQKDSEGIIALFPDLPVPANFLHFITQHNMMDLLQLSLEHPINERETEILLALQLALQHWNFEAIYHLVNALHGPLPPCNTKKGRNRLYDTIIAHNYVSNRHFCRNVLSRNLPKWERELTRRWILRTLLQ